MPKQESAIAIADPPPAIKPKEATFSTEPLKDLPRGSMHDPNLPEAKIADFSPTRKPLEIFMLAERLTPLHNPDKEVINVHHKLGYWTDRTLVEAAAKRHSLIVQEICDGKERV
jgi:hypothetical protein